MIPNSVRFLVVVGSAVLAAQLHGAGLSPSETRFYYRDAYGQQASAPIVRQYWPRTVRRFRVPVTHAPAKVDPRIDPKLRRAATIADERANAKSKSLCWRYVKQALLQAGAVDSYPSTNYATQAGVELTQKYGFTKLTGVHDPYSAPLGAVLVYAGRGHVEIRTQNGFASDYHSKNRCKYPFYAAYAKLSGSGNVARNVASVNPRG